MKLILLSGGSGKRLWPLSNDSRSKQFLKVLPGQKNGMESMMQRVWRQLEATGMQKSAWIAAGKTHVDMIHSQIGQEAPLIIEPERRDTFSAIVLAAVYLYSVQGVSLNEVVGVLPVDPYVEDHFFYKVAELEKAIHSSKADLALIGIEPTFPSSKYGYIIPEQEKTDQPYFHVSHFKEKPSEEKAKELLEEKAYWNAGVFAFKLEFIISMLEEKGWPIQYEELLRQYSMLPKQSFDYEVVEKAHHIIVLPYKGYWKDLGTWNTLTEEMAAHQIGEGVMSKSCTDTHLINELGIPVTVIGLKNAVVAVSPDGILVADKEESPKIKELLAGIGRRPMYEERRWGWYRVLDHTTVETGMEVLTKRIGVKANHNLSYQKHKERSEVWTLIKGTGEFALNGFIYQVKAGDVLHIPVGSEHGIKALTDLEFIEVQTGACLVEEDILRIFMNWDEVASYCNQSIS